jgi:hypothetical protein
MNYLDLRGIQGVSMMCEKKITFGNGYPGSRRRFALIPAACAKGLRQTEFHLKGRWTCRSFQYRRPSSRGVAHTIGGGRGMGDTFATGQQTGAAA